MKIKGFNSFSISREGVVTNGEGKELRGSICGHGYHRFSLNKDSKTYYRYGHILVADAFIPNPKGYKLVNHLAGDKMNNCDWNLQRATYSMNLQHAYDTGLRGSPEKRKNAATTEDEVLEIRRRFKDGERQCDLAKDLGLSASFISKIVLRKEWKHI